MSGESYRTRRRRLQRQQIQEGDTDPFNLARTFVQADGVDEKGRVTLRYWRSEWYRYRKGRFARIEEATLRIELTTFIKCHFDENKIVDRQGNVLQVGKGLVANTLAALGSIVAVGDDIEQPVWLGDGKEGPFLAVTNGLLDLKGLTKGGYKVKENSPDWFSTTALGAAYHADAACPGWLKFLEQMLEGDQQRITFLQEWFGYSLVPDTTLHKFVAVEGEGANGKSVVLETLTALLGPENVSHVPLEVFGQRFQLTSTLGKLANICAEVGEIDKMAEGFLKQFTAGDRMHFDRKGISPVESYPTARLILSTNVRPRIKDRSSGMWRRMVVMPFNVTIPLEDQDPHLPRKLKEELPGILKWALEGLRRVKQHQGFTIPAECQSALDEYRKDSNPAKTFLLEHCEANDTASVPCGVLYERYAVWAKANGFEALDARQFGKEVRRAFPLMKRERSASDGARVWVYAGVSYVPSSPNDSYPDPI